MVGATERPGSYGGEALLNLRRFGFDGRRVRASTRGARRCTASRACRRWRPAGGARRGRRRGPGGRRAASAVEEAGALGCGGAVVFAAGFAEAGGGALQARLVAAARRTGCRCAARTATGSWRSPTRAALWGDMVAPREAGPGRARLPERQRRGQRARVAARAAAAHGRLVRQRGGARRRPTTSRRSPSCDGVRSIALYLEDDGDGERWCAALERCARGRRRVAVLKAGRHRAGAAAAQAHTGAVAGDQRAFRAFVEDVRRGVGDATRTSCSSWPRRSRAGRRGGAGTARGAAVMTCSGGDSASPPTSRTSIGVALPALAPRDVAALEALLPAAATRAEPARLHVAAVGRPRRAARARARARRRPAGRPACSCSTTSPPGSRAPPPTSWAAVLDAVVAAARATGRPVLVASTLPELLVDDDLAAGAAARRHPRRSPGMPPACGRWLRSGCATGRRAPAPDAAARRRARPLRRRATTRGDATLARRARGEGAAADAGLPVPDGPPRRATPTTPPPTQAALGGAGRDQGRPALRHKTDASARVGSTSTDAGARRAAPLRAAAVARTATRCSSSGWPPPGAELLVAARADGVVPVLVVGLGGLWPRRSTTSRSSRCRRARSASSARCAPARRRRADRRRGRPRSTSAAARLAAAPASCCSTRPRPARAQPRHRPTRARRRRRARRRHSPVPIATRRPAMNADRRHSSARSACPRPSRARRTRAGTRSSSAAATTA